MTTSPQPRRPISLAYLFCAWYQKSRNIYGRNNLSIRIMKKIKFKYLNKKYNILNSIIPICVMILQNPPGNNVVSLIPIFINLKFYSLIEFIIKKLPVVVYFLIVQERKTNLFWVVGPLLSNLLPNTYMSIRTYTLFARWQLTRWAYIKRGAWSWLISSDSLSLEALQEELAALLSVLLINAFSLTFKQIKVLKKDNKILILKNSAAPPLYERLPKINVLINMH